MCPESYSQFVSKIADWIIILFVNFGAAICFALAAPALSAQEQNREVIKDNKGRVVRIITTRNDGSKVVTDASGRVVSIIRTDNSGRTRVSDASGVVRSTLEPRDTVGRRYRKNPLR